MNDKSNEIGIEMEYLLEADICDAFNFLSTPDNDIIWQSSCCNVKRSQPQATITVGSRYEILFKFLSRKLLFETEVNEYQLNNSYGYKSLKGPIDYHGRYEFSQCDQGVQVYWTFSALLGNFFGIIPKAIIKKTMLKKASEDIEYLKTLFINDDPLIQRKVQQCQA